MAKKLILNNWEVILGFIFILWLVAEIFIRFEPSSNFPNDDSAVFLYIGRGILNGRIPYRDIWDHKGPLLYYIDAFGLSLFNLWGVWGIQFILTFAGFFAAYLSGRKLFGAAPALFGILSGFYLLDLFAAGNITEEYSSIFALLSFGLFFLHSRNSIQRLSLFGIGFLFICTFLTRPNNVGFQSAIILSMGLTDIIKKDFQGLKTKIVWTATGMLVLLVPFAIYFKANHALGEFYDQAFRYNIIYIEASQTSINFSKFLHSPLNYLFLLATVSYSAVLFSARNAAFKAQFLESNLIYLLLLAFPIEFFLSHISGRGYNHYYLTWVPYFIFAPGFLAKKICGIFSKITFNNNLLLSLIVLAYMIIRPPQQTFAKYISIENHFIYNRSNGVEKKHPLIDFVHDNTTPQDTVLRWGFGRWINYAVERESPSRYLYQLEFSTPGYVTDKMINEFENDITRNKPKFIIEAINYFIPLDSEKLSRYTGYVHPKYYEIVKFIEGNYHIVKLNFYAEGQNKEDKWIKVWILNSSE